MSVAPLLNLEIASRIYGWMTEAELQFLAECASKSKTILEIGSFQGRSTRALADNSPSDATIIAVDPWDYYIQPGLKSDDQTFGLFRINLADHIKSGKVIPVKNIYRNFQSDTKFDFIFIDGDHYAKSIEYDIEKSLGLLKSGGIISGHDYCDKWPDVAKVVDNIFPNVNVTESIWWIKK